MIEKIIKLYRKVLCRFNKHELEVWTNLPQYLLDVMKEPNYLGGEYLKCKHCKFVSVKISVSSGVYCEECDGIY